jgi:hypothetical protein
MGRTGAAGAIHTDGPSGGGSKGSASSSEFIVVLFIKEEVGKIDHRHIGRRRWD